jgi:tetratricopeptide (TPR) repeat protein
MDINMDETLKQAYHEMIYELLINSAAKSALVLKKSLHLIDQNFVDFLGEMSTLLAERNCPEDAERLATLHQQLQEADTIEAWLAEHTPKPVAAPKKPALSPQQQQEKAEQLFQQGTQHFNANEYAEAIQVWQQALLLYQGGEDIKGGINCLGKLGNLYQILGQYQQAISAHQRALGFSKKIKYRRGEANALNSLGQVCTLLGQYDRAISCYQEALEISQKIKFRTAEIQGLNYLGQVHYALGQYQKALDYHQQALILAKQRDLSFAQAYSLSSLGHTYAALQNSEEAINFYQQALTLFQGGNYPFPQANCLRNLGLIYQRLGNTKEALNYTNAYLDLGRRLNYQIAEANGILDLAEIYNSQEKYEEAIAYCQQSIEVRQRLQDVQGQAKTLNCLGNIYQASQQFERALETFQNSLDLAVPQLFPQEHFKAAQQLGNLAIQLKDWELAIQAYQQAIQVLEQLNISSIINIESPDEFEGIERQTYSRLIQIYIQQNEYESAVEIIERFRCYQLVRSLSDTELLVRDEIAEDVELYQRLQRQMNALHFRRQSDEMKPLSSSGLNLNSHAGLQVEATALTVLETETKKIWQRLQDSDPALAARLRVIPLSFTEIQNLSTDKNTAILSFFFSESEINIFVIDAHQVRLHKCVEADIQTFKTWLKESWFKPCVEKTLQWRDQMGEILLQLAQQLNLSQLVSDQLQDVQELIIIPDGNLHWLPFAALPILINDQPEYLGDRFQLRIIPNCQSLSFCSLQEPINSPILGIIEYPSNSNIFNQYLCQKIAHIQDKQEINYLKSEQASMSQFETLIQQYHHLYASFPIQFNLQNLGQTQWQFDNESCPFAKVMNWDFSHLLEVFLSNCKIQFTDLSLLTVPVHPMAHLLYSGSQKVISPLWQMDTIANVIFSLLYYKNRQTLSIELAFQSAQNQLRNLTLEAFKNRLSAGIRKIYSQSSN